MISNEDDKGVRRRAMDMELLQRARECYEGLREFRAGRERCKRFCYGDQWDDLIDDRGVKMRERDFIVSQGNMPLCNNLIRRLVRNVLGVYRDRWKAPQVQGVADADRLNRMLATNMALNRMEELYARTLEDFLIGGLAVHRKWYGRRGGFSACRTDMVQPDKFFFDKSARDFRGSDLAIVGELHTIRFEELAASFARSPRDCGILRRIYGVGGHGEWRGVCEVWEVWERRRPMRLYCHDPECGRMVRREMEQDDLLAENAIRLRQGRRPIETLWRTDEEWRYTFLAPTGHVLSSGLSPYRHGAHPFVMKAYPYIDGEIHSFVSDVIDQQKFTNRLISMYDWILRASAKGVLLFPEGSLPEGTDMNDIADEWGRFNGVIVYRPRVGVPLPQQVSSKSSDIGITELLEIQMKMMEDISGVNGALQGKLESNSMSGTLYDQQTRNSLTALADLLKSFDDFTAEATRLDVSNLRQFGGD